MSAEEKDSARAYVFDAAFPTNAQPFKVHAEDGGVVLFEFGTESFRIITNLYEAGKGKRLRVMVEVEDE